MSNKRTKAELEEENKSLTKNYTKSKSRLNSLFNLILGPNYYNMMMDCDSCSEQMIRDCDYILKDPFVRYFIERRVKRDFGFSFNPRH